MRLTSRRLSGFILSLGVFAYGLPVKTSGQWIEKPGKGWFQVGVYHQNTRQRFDEQGNVEPLFNEGGRSITTSVFLTGVMGLYRGVDVWAQMPFHSLSFNDISAARKSLGPGDPLLHVRLGPALFGLESPVPWAVRAGVKIPVGSFPVDSEIVPLTQGQRDWEVMLEIGHSFYPTPMYVMGWIGYRWREANHLIDRKPGNERFAFITLGGSKKQLHWKLSAEGILGTQWTGLTGVQIPLAMSERKLVQLTPTIGWALKRGIVELGGRLPVAGQNFPAGPALFAGYFVRINQ